MTYTFLAEDFLGYFFIFVRLSVICMLMPGIGEIYVPPRIRLLCAFILTLIVGISLQPTFPVTSLHSFKTLVILGKETIIGVYIGSVIRLLLNMLQVTATIIGMQTSLSSAVIFNPSLGTQDTIFSQMLLNVAIVLIFASDSHYDIIRVFMLSYKYFPVGEDLFLEDMAYQFVSALSYIFAMDVQLAFPIILVSSILILSSGLLNRLMPQLQVYFMMLPLQILMGYGIMSMLVGYILTAFLDHFKKGFQMIFHYL